MNTKRFLAGLTAAGMLMSGAVFAAEAQDDVMLISAPAVTEEATIVNGGAVSPVEAVIVNDIAMIPLRHVAESLGFTVTWHEDNWSIDLTQGAVFITMQIDADSYAFSRRAPQTLGAAPTLVNGATTYVPISFVTEILGGVYTNIENNLYEIVTPSHVTVAEILEDGALLVQDEVRGEVVVYITEETAIVAGDKEATVDAIEVGSELNIGYAPAMTMSIPPQTSARFIEIAAAVTEVEEETQEGVAFSGTITEIIEEMVVLGTPGEDENAIALIITEDTQLEGELEVGMEIEGLRSERATFSIPPQSVALSINIVK